MEKKVKGGERGGEAGKRLVGDGESSGERWREMEGWREKESKVDRDREVERD